MIPRWLSMASRFHGEKTRVGGRGVPIFTENSANPLNLPGIYRNGAFLKRSCTRLSGPKRVIYDAIFYEEYSVQKCTRRCTVAGSGSPATYNNERRIQAPRFRSCLSVSIVSRVGDILCKSGLFPIRRRHSRIVREPQKRLRSRSGRYYPATLIETFNSTSVAFALSTLIFRSSGLIESSVE